jgi:hypothetical protein
VVIAGEHVFCTQIEKGDYGCTLQALNIGGVIGGEVVT